METVEAVVWTIAIILGAWSLITLIHGLTDTVSSQSVSDVLPDNTKEGEAGNTILIEALNVEYTCVQSIIKQLEKLEKVKEVYYEYENQSGNITARHEGSTQDIVDELLSINSSIEVIQVIKGHIIIKL